MRRSLRKLVVVLFATAVACAEPPPEDTLDLHAVLAGDTAGYARAVAPREFEFPRDHGPHPAFKTEWWYYTGNLVSAGGQRYGFQLTFFRSALSPRPGGGESPWRARQAWMAHFALTDAAQGTFHAAERFSREAVGLAGARAEPYRVWLYSWEAAARGGGAHPTMRVSASDGEVSIDLALDPAKPPVLQGENGLSQKGNEPGNASYYYSLTRLRARGTVRAGAEPVPVSGSAWMDREWSTSVLEENQAGWDWFALQLDDTTEVMVYHLRRRDGTTDPRSRGVVVGAAGESAHLAPGAFRLEVLDWWESPRGGVYPASWRLSVQDPPMELAIEPLLDDQELDLSFRYWEGAVRVSGSHAGVGYVELTGYASGGDAGARGGV